MVIQIDKIVYNNLYLLKIHFNSVIFNIYVHLPLFQLKSIYTNNYIYLQSRSQNEHYLKRRKHRRGNPDVKLSVSMGRAVLQFFEVYENKA
jgi:hypothetical protein